MQLILVLSGSRSAAECKHTQADPGDLGAACRLSFPTVIISPSIFVLQKKLCRCLPLLFLRSFIFCLPTGRSNALIHPSTDRTPSPVPSCGSSRLTAPDLVISKWQIVNCCFANDKKTLCPCLKICNRPLPLFSRLNSLYGCAQPSPPRALHPCVPSGPLYHAGAPSLRAN